MERRVGSLQGSRPRARPWGESWPWREDFNCDGCHAKTSIVMDVHDPVQWEEIQLLSLRVPIAWSYSSARRGSVDRSVGSKRWLSGLSTSTAFDHLITESDVLHNMQRESRFKPALPFQFQFDSDLLRTILYLWSAGSGVSRPWTWVADTWHHP